MSKIIGVFYNILIEILLNITKAISKIPFSKIYIKTPFIYQIFLYYLFIILFRYFINKKYFQKIIKYKNKIISVFLIIILIPNVIDIFPKGDLKIYFIDVGQGDSCLIVTEQNKKILIDGGGSENYDVGKNILLPYLLNRRINKIDYMIVSHFDTDHVRRT